MKRIASRPFLAALAGAACLISSGAVAQNPADFTTQLRPRYWVGDEEIRYTLEERMAHYGVPGIAVAVIENGDLIYAAGFGELQAGGGEAVDADTVFSAGSVSKIATAALTLRLHEAGVVDMHAPVSAQLESWDLPDGGAFNEDAVTLRGILSHTAGFNLHGFADFQPGAVLPSVYDTLNGQSPSLDGPLELTFEPGSRYRYSGGGYTLAQLLIADQTEQSFADAANAWLFEPLGMTRSSFANPLPEDHGNIAKAHGRNGEPVALPRGYEAMPEMAASGLWVSATDLGRLVQALIASYRAEGGYLDRSTALDMMSRVSRSEHGLGPRLEYSGEDYFFHHAGANNSYHAWIEGHLATGDGLVVLTNGANGNPLHQEIRNAVADAMGWRINAPNRLPELDLTPADLGAMTGVYTEDDTFPLEDRRQMLGWIYGSDWQVTQDETGLRVGRVGRQNTSRLIPVSPTRFVLEGVGMREGMLELEFERDVSGRVDALTLHLVNARARYVRLADTAQ